MSKWCANGEKIVCLIFSIRNITISVVQGTRKNGCPPQLSSAHWNATPNKNTDVGTAEMVLSDLWLVYSIFFIMHCSVSKCYSAVTFILCWYNLQTTILISVRYNIYLEECLSLHHGFCTEVWELYTFQQYICYCWYIWYADCDGIDDDVEECTESSNFKWDEYKYQQPDHGPNWITRTSTHIVFLSWLCLLLSYFTTIALSITTQVYKCTGSRCFTYES